MTTTPQPATETVRVHETPYVLRVEIDLPDAKPQMLFAVTNRGLEIRIFHTMDDQTGRETEVDSAQT
jgi:hypothetical protein